MYMYQHLLDSELKKTPLKLSVESLEVVGTSIVTYIKSGKYSDIRVRIIGESVNDILDQLSIKMETLSKFYK